MRLLFKNTGFEKRGAKGLKQNDDWGGRENKSALSIYLVFKMSDPSDVHSLNPILKLQVLAGPPMFQISEAG